jgi:hypothetical protein
MSVTLSTARAEVAARAQEFLQGIATGGSASTLVGANDLTHVDGYWAEAVVLMTSGTNAGASRRVMTFTSSTATMNFYSSFTGAVASGDQFEVYRRFTPTDVDKAINRSINVAAPDFREKVRAVATAVADTLQYAVPSGVAMLDKGLIGIEYQYYTQSTQSTWPFTKLSSDLYEIIEDFNGTDNIRTLQLKFNPETNRLIRFVYDGPLGNVSTGTDVIHLDLPELEWLYSQSCAELWRIETSRTTDANRKAALEELARWEVNADRLRRQLGQQQPARPIRRTRFQVI